MEFAMGCTHDRRCRQIAVLRSETSRPSAWGVGAQALTPYESSTRLISLNSHLAA
jgi:hypothetical protein